MLFARSASGALFIECVVRAQRERRFIRVFRRFCKGQKRAISHFGQNNRQNANGESACECVNFYAQFRKSVEGVRLPVLFPARGVLMS
eukprot:639276-Prymnesium_polylepis.1